MEKIDFKKKLAFLYGPKKGKMETVKVPAMKFVMIDGRGNPNTSEDFKEAMNILYPISFGLKFMMKQRFEKDYVVMPPEGLWWADDMDDFLKKEKESWLWTIMIMQPDFIEECHFEEAAETAVKKGKITAEQLQKTRFETFEEGESVQTMYIGTFDDETSTIDSMHRMIAENGWKLSGKHHEIYLSDFRRTAPEKLKTIIRQPFAR